MATLAPTEARPANRYRWLAFLLIAGVLVWLVFFKLGLYSVQPIGALPNGATALVWRTAAEPRFNSPDALCLRIQGGVSLLCRGIAMGQAPLNRILLRLPYQNWAYEASTGGQQFNR